MTRPFCFLFSSFVFCFNSLCPNAGFAEAQTTFVWHVCLCLSVCLCLCLCCVCVCVGGGYSIASDSFKKIESERKV